MEEAGFLSGDVVTDINGDGIVVSREIGVHFQFSPLSGEAVDVTVLRDGQKITKSVVPKLVTNQKGKQQYMLGFSYGDREKLGVLGTIKYSAYEVKYWIETTVKSLGAMIRGKVSKDEIAGPVGIVSMVGDMVDDTVKESKKSEEVRNVLLTLINFSILLSANLGVMNLLPIPALDGGRLLFLIIEWIRRKPLNPKFEGIVNFAGFAALMLLMVFVMFNDIMKLLPA